MKTQKLIPLTALTVALAATLLTGCSTHSSTEHTALPAATRSATTAPAPVETMPAPAAVPKAGDLITTVAQQKAAENAGLKVYTFTGKDGGVAYDPAQPLPDAVKADIAAPVAAAVEAADGQSGPAVSQSARNAAANATNATGKKTIVVFGAKAQRTENSPLETLYGAMSYVSNPELGHRSVSNSAAETVAIAQAWVATQPDAADWEIVVAN